MDIKTFSKLQAGYEQSGLSIKAYCLKAGIIYTSFLYWRKKFSSTVVTLKTNAPAASPFVELIPSTSTQENSISAIKCSVGPVTIHLPHNSSPAQWRNLLFAVREVFSC